MVDPRYHSMRIITARKEATHWVYCTKCGWSRKVRRTSAEHNTIREAWLGHANG